MDRICGPLSSVQDGGGVGPLSVQDGGVVGSLSSVHYGGGVGALSSVQGSGAQDSCFRGVSLRWCRVGTLSGVRGCLTIWFMWMGLQLVLGKVHQVDG